MDILDILVPSIFPSLILPLSITFEVLFLTLFEAVRIFELVKLYGLPGLALYFFGNRTTWRLQAQVLGYLKDEDAFAFKKSVRDECAMISVAAALVAQINVTALSLNLLSETHWVARGFIVWSLTSSLMAVFYAVRQQRSVGRLLEAKRIRQWIRGGSEAPGRYRIINSVAYSDPKQALGRIAHIFMESVELLGFDINRRHIIAQIALRPEKPCDANDIDETVILHWDTANSKDLKQKLIANCFLPSVPTVITISAPQILLSVSLFTLLITLGIYFGFTWTRNLDTNAGIDDSRNVFIFYIVGLAVCIIVYSISGIIQDSDNRTESKIVEGYCDEWLDAHKEQVSSWGYHIMTHAVTKKLSLVRTLSEHEVGENENREVYTQVNVE